MRKLTSIFSALALAGGLMSLPAAAQELPAESSLQQETAAQDSVDAPMGDVQEQETAPADESFVGVRAAQGCSYATSSSADYPYANTICWLDFSDFNPTVAAAGQAMTIQLGNGYTISLTATVTGHPVRAVAAPSFSRAAFGNNGASGNPNVRPAYAGLQGNPVLYQNSSPSGTGINRVTTVQLSGITVKDPAGVPVDGFGMVAIDGESTNRFERFDWSSDKPLRRIDTHTNLCDGGLTGVGTTSVQCTGTVDGVKGALTLAADTPTRISATMRPSSLSVQGAAFGVMVSKAEVNKSVVSRQKPTDSFDVEAVNPNGTVVANSSTGTGASASTGSATLIVNNGDSVTLREAATAGSGTDLTGYDKTWACLANGAAVNATQAADGTSVTVPIGIGDSVSCTVTNTARAGSPSLSVSKVHDWDPSAPAKVVNYSVTVTNTGAADYTAVNPAQLRDDLSGVLDDATYNNDAQVSFSNGSTSAAPTYAAPALSWAGALKAGESATITYSVTQTGGGDKDVLNTACVDNGNSFGTCDTAQFTTFPFCVKAADPSLGARAKSMIRGLFH